MSSGQKINQLYPEIEKYGSIGDALNFEFSNISSPLLVSFLYSKHFFAFVEFQNKFTETYLAEYEKLFLTEFWRDGVSLASCATPELNELARAIDFWLTKNVSTKEFAQTFQMITPGQHSAAFDENREVEYKWNYYLINDWHKELRSFLEVAKEDEMIGKLFPFTSLDSLCFSRCTGYPYTSDTPIVLPNREKKGLYEVLSHENELLGKGSAEEALKILKANMPKDIKPAIKGTADDLKN
jgi:Family of unknown function (DUF6193)